jgi:hypothetical protein
MKAIETCLRRLETNSWNTVEEEDDEKQDKEQEEERGLITLSLPVYEDSNQSFVLTLNIILISLSITRNLVICTHHQILFGCSNQEE